MRVEGRLITFFSVLIVNLAYIGYYYVRDGYISLIEYIGLPLLLAVAWWFGKQYDKPNFIQKRIL